MYTVNFTPIGESSLAKLDREIGQRIFDKVKWLAQNLDNLTPQPLKGRFSGLYKLKVGDWRVIYEIVSNEKIVTIHSVGHRKEIYRI